MFKYCEICKAQTIHYYNDDEWMCVECEEAERMQEEENRLSYE